MATIEERLTALEQEQAELKQRNEALSHDNEELKQKVELHTVALGGLVNKAMLERLNEKNDKIFEALQNHDRLTNDQLAELRNQHTQLDGKIVAVQAEMRQRFDQQDKRFDQQDKRFGEQGSKLDRLENMLSQVLARLPEKP